VADTFCRHALAVKEDAKIIDICIKKSSKTFKYVKAQPNNSRLFKLLCNKTGNKYEALILHTEFLWLSRPKVLVTVFQLREELLILLSGKEHH
jgi:hypothetical protein